MKIFAFILLMPWMLLGSEPLTLKEEGLRGMPWLSLHGPDGHKPFLDVLRVELAKADIPLAGHEQQGWPGLVTLQIQAVPGGIMMSLDIDTQCQTINGADCIATVWTSTRRGATATQSDDIEAAVKSAIRDHLATELAAAWLKANPKFPQRPLTIRE